MNNRNQGCFIPTLSITFVVLGVLSVIVGVVLFGDSSSFSGTIFTVIGIVAIALFSLFLYNYYTPEPKSSVTLIGFAIALVICVCVCIFGFKSCKNELDYKSRHPRSGKYYRKKHHSISMPLVIWYSMSCSEIH